MVHINPSGEFYYKRRVGRVYQTVEVNKNTVYTVQRYCRKSKSFSGLRGVIIQVIPVINSATPELGYSCVIYSCSNNAETVSQNILPYGNSTKKRDHT